MKKKRGKACSSSGKGCSSQMQRLDSHPLASFGSPWVETSPLDTIPGRAGSSSAWSLLKSCRCHSTPGQLSCRQRLLEPFWTGMGTAAQSGSGGQWEGVLGRASLQFSLCQRKKPPSFSGGSAVETGAREPHMPCAPALMCRACLVEMVLIELLSDGF